MPSTAIEPLRGARKPAIKFNNDVLPQAATDKFKTGYDRGVPIFAPIAEAQVRALNRGIGGRIGPQRTDGAEH